MLEVEIGFLPLSAPEISPGTGRARGVVSLCGVIQHKAPVLEVRFWCQDLNFSISVPPSHSCPVLSPGRVLTTVHGDLWSPFRGIPSPFAMAQLCLQTGFAGSFWCLAESPG